MEELEKDINEKLLKKKKLFGMINICILMLILVCFGITALIRRFSILTLIVFLIAVFIFFIKFWYKDKFLKSVKKEIFTKVFPNLLDNYKFIYCENGISKDEFIHSGMYKNYTDYYTSDGVKTFFGDLYIANVKAIRKEEDRKVDVFTGVFGYIQTDEFYEDEILIKPDIENKYLKNIFDETNKLLGDFDSVVRLENNEFERYFEVYSKNQLKARQVLTPYYMENLLRLKEKLDAPIKILYKENKKYIAVWNKRIIDENYIYKNGVDFKIIKGQLEEIVSLLKE